MGHIKDEFQAANLANIIVALWLLMAPFVIGFTELAGATGNSLAVGIAMLLVALYGAFMPLHKPGLIWINFALGLWLLVAPFLLGFSENLFATLSHIAMGGIVAGLAGGSAIGARWSGE